jgi:hypothetical protein
MFVDLVIEFSCRGALFPWRYSSSHASDSGFFTDFWHDNVTKKKVAFHAFLYR